MTAIYCTIQDLRDEGVSASELSDARALELIESWQFWIDDMTGQFFSSRSGSIDFDGDGSRMLLLPFPNIACSALYINDDFVNAVNTAYYTVYNARGPLQDDRKNPHIMLKRSGSGNIYTQTDTTFIFEVGDRNQRVTGTWGYTESDGSVPVAIHRAVMILVIATMEFLPDSDLDQLMIGRKVEEVTDRHRIQYSDLFNRLKVWSPTGITEVDMALRRYRSPTKVSAPRTMLAMS